MPTVFVEAKYAGTVRTRSECALVSVSTCAKDRVGWRTEHLVLSGAFITSITILYCLVGLLHASATRLCALDRTDKCVWLSSTFAYLVQSNLCCHFEHCSVCDIGHLDESIAACRRKAASISVTIARSYSR